MKITKENILKFINSPDKENVYTIAVSLRKDTILTGVSHSHLLKLIPVDDRVHTLEDIYDELELSEDQVVIYKNAVTPLERFINACMIIPKIVEVYNEGVVLDWNNINQDKYLPYLQKTDSGWSFRGTHGWRVVASGPCAFHYRTSDSAKQGVTKFIQVYIDYLSFKG